MAKFKKLASGEWTVYGDEINQNMREVLVQKADGSSKIVKLTGLWSMEGGVKCWRIQDLRPKMTRRGYGRDDGVCLDCELNMDTGDGRGCSRHRGNPKV